MKFLALILSISCCLFSEYLPFEEGFFSPPINLRHAREFAAAYQNNHYSKVSLDQKDRIPKIIHHIWLGSELPKRYQQYVDSWKDHHPDWEHKLWTDADIDSFPLVTGDIIHRVQNQGQRSDILRLEILNRFGGLYVDTDFLCLKPHDIIHKSCDFYSGFGGTTIYIGIIGSIPNHPIITRYLNVIKNRAVFKQDCSSIMKATGPVGFTSIVHNYIQKSQEGVIIFPPIYYYPFPGDLRYYYWANDQDFSFVKPFITEYAFAVHLWACSWVKLPLQQNNHVPSMNRRFPCQRKPRNIPLR